MATTAQQAFQTALAHHQAGQLREAEAIYRQILGVDPDHADSVHLLGVVALQVNQHEVAIEYISRAIKLQGNQPIYHSNLGEAYRGLGKLAEAAECYRQALSIDPSFSHAHNNLGNVLKSLGQTADAIAAYERAIRLQPDYAEPHNNLATILQEQGDLAGAIAHYRQAVALNPRYAGAYKNLGTALRIQGSLAEALECCQQALRLDPQDSETHYNIAIILNERNETSAAAAAYLEALRLKPDYTEALVHYGRLLQSRGQLDDAFGYYDRAVRSNPNFGMAHFHRANIYRIKRMASEASAGYEEALRLQPNYPEAYNNLAVLFNTACKPDMAVECCQRGLALNPKSSELHDNMASAVQAQGRAEEAIAWFRKAVELQSRRAPKSAAHSNLLYGLNFVPGIDPVTLFAEHRAWAQEYADPLTALGSPHPNDRTPDRRLRVGYVSPHFRGHAVNFFIEPMLGAHDHTQFEIFCYSGNPFDDAVTARLKAAADHWRDIRDKPDELVAQMVRDDRIDILVDLTGHIGENRLLVFARKPAPIQVTYIGYQNTTGMTAMDYRLTDERTDPLGLSDPFYTEQLVRLPRSFFCYRPPDEAPPITPLRASAAGYVTFGSFNNFAKVSPPTIAAWLQILAAVPKSRLMVLANCGGYVERHLYELAQQHRIDRERIEICDKRPTAEYFRLLERADIALDPFPFTGHTTTCDSIWMGVPVVMLEGNTYASRFGGSVLANVGLEHLITRCVEQYVEVAVELAADMDNVAQMRAELRPRMAGSALLDFAGFTRNVEHAYRQMWLTWCDSSENRG
ncbi:MAG: tetratricopeptide repeat protein [Planctomycetia bacterium]|nr:tetratricopeptide repeat protein [Planctomycetia bacterium]